MVDEIELKLELTPETVELVASSGVLPHDFTTAKQISIYFDTPAQTLRKAGFTLRIRRCNGKRIQTVKADGASAAGLFARSEWERSVKTDTPIIDDATPLGALLGSESERVMPLFEVHVERRTWNVHQDNSTIEVVVDRGHVVANDRSSSICEMELELKDGNSDALFTLARQIDAVVPLRLGVLTKSQRGYQLTRPVMTVFNAEPLGLINDRTAAQAFQQIVQICLRQFRLNESLLQQGRNIEALHQARVALRRLRSAFSIFKPLLDRDDAVSLRGELKWLASELGDARNLDVLLGRLTVGSLRQRLESARHNAYAKVDVTFASSRVRGLMLDLAQWAAIGVWLHAPDRQKSRDQTARDFARSTLGRLRKKVKKDGLNLVDATNEVRHELRKDAKKLRYASEFFAALFDSKRQKRRNKRFITALEELQDQLGLLNDLVSAPQVLDTLGLADDPDADALLNSNKKKPLLDAAADAHEVLVDTKRFWR